MAHLAPSYLPVSVTWLYPASAHTCFTLFNERSLRYHDRWFLWLRLSHVRDLARSGLVTGCAPFCLWNDNEAEAIHIHERGEGMGTVSLLPGMPLFTCGGG